jgi:hypothetical protein
MSESRLLNGLRRGYAEGILHARTKRPLDSISEVRLAVGFVEEILFTLVAGNLPRRNLSHKSSLTIYFHLKAMRGKVNKIALEGSVLLKPCARFRPSLK